MRDENDGVSLSGKVLNEGHQLFRFLRRENRRRLVHDQQAGILINRFQDLDLLLNADRETADPGFRVDFESMRRR